MASNFTDRPSTSNRDGRSLLLPEGDWEHVTQNAGGANFHLACAGPKDGEPVILLHDFPRTWYSMRHALVALADAGFRAYAMDLRGFGTSDLQPYGQDPLRMSADVAAVIESLGYPSAHVVGAGMGGQLGWILAATNPAMVTSLVTIAAPHPLTVHDNVPKPFTPAGRTVARIRIPWANIKQLRSGDLINRTTETWGGPDTKHLIDEDAAVYHYAFSRTFAAETALEVVIRVNALTVRVRKRIDRVVEVPVSSVVCAQDPLRPPKLFARDQQWVREPINTYTIEQSGHFPTEEAVDELNHAILHHLRCFVGGDCE